MITMEIIEYQLEITLCTPSLLNDGNVAKVCLHYDYITDFDGNVRQLDAFASPNRLNFISASQGSSNGTLISGEIATYTATYTVQNADNASGGISNTASATSYVYVNGDPMVHARDQSDDGDDTDGNTENDPTLSILAIYLK